MNNAFHLLRLPSKPLTTVLESLDFLEVISFSFISKTTKSLTIPLKREAVALGLCVGDAFLLTFLDKRMPTVVTFDFCSFDGPVPLRIRDHGVVVHCAAIDLLRHSSFRWRKEGYGIKDWIMHTMQVTNTLEIDELLFNGMEELFSNVSIKTAIEGLDIQTLRISDRCSDRFQQSILETFHLKNLFLGRIPYPNPQSIHQGLMQNFDEIHVDSEVRINELLLMNAKKIRLFSRENDIWSILNKFLKTWKTGSNPRMESLLVRFFEDNDFDVNALLKGITYQVMAPDQEVLRRYCFQSTAGKRVTIEIRTKYCLINFVSI